MTEEGDLKARIREYLNERGIYWANVKGGAHSKNGDPDMILFYRSYGIAMEAKTYQGEISGWQNRTARRVLNNVSQGCYIRVRTLSDLKNFLDAIDNFIDSGGSFPPSYTPPPVELE